MSELDLKKLKKSIEENAKKIEGTLDKGKDAFVDFVKSFFNKLDPADAVIYTGLAYLGYENLPGRSDIVKLLWGPVALKLATTPSEGGSASLGLLGVQVPVNSQIAGLAMLAGLGLASLPWDGVGGEALWIHIGKDTQEEKDIISTLRTWLSKDFISDTTRQGLQASLNAILHRTKPREQAIREARAWIEAANAELQAIPRPDLPAGPELPPGFVPPLTPPPPRDDADALLREILAEYGDVMTPQEQARAYELSLTGYQFLYGWSRGMSTIWRERKGEI